MWFSVEFDISLIFQGFEGIFGGIVVIFSGVESGKMLDFSGVCRSGYRSDYLGGFLIKYFGNADFTRGLWVEQMYLVLQSNICSKM